jgi:hypothetical protein
MNYKKEVGHERRIQGRLWWKNEWGTSTSEKW